MIKYQHRKKLFLLVKGDIMPAYEYVCKDCNEEFIVFLSVKEYDAKPTVKCPHCESDNVVKRITGFFAKTSKKS